MALKTPPDTAISALTVFSRGQYSTERNETDGIIIIIIYFTS